MAVQLYFLGAPHFRRNGEPVVLAPAKAVALLAYLAAAARPQPRDRLLGLLWAESAEDAARKNLRNVLWTVRRVLGNETVVTDGEMLALGSDVWADHREFTALSVQLLSAFDRSLSGNDPEPFRSVLSLYDGPFLDGLLLAEAPEFELWSSAERERLAQLYLRCLAALAGIYRAAGHWEDMIATSQRAIESDNLQEPLYRYLMEGYFRLGDRTAAIRQYEILRSVLNRELGVEPLPETEALHTAIVNAAMPSVTATPKGAEDTGKIPEAGRPIVPGPPRWLANSPPLAQSLPFVGRSPERAMLDAEIAATAEGARIVLITGEVGIGKSRLWHEWSRHLPPDPRRLVLEARCLESTQALPFAPLVQLLRSPTCFRELSSPTTLPRIWLAEISRLLPEIRLSHPDLPQPVQLPTEEERRRLFEAIVQGLLALETEPLLFFLDDVHWADQTTLDWLGYLVDRMRDRPLLLALAYRTDERAEALERLAAGWTRLGIVRRLPIPRLTQEESAHLITELEVNPSLAHNIQAWGSGNPYFMIELARAGQPSAPSGIPPALADLIRARQDRLSGSARQVLQAAAVLEPDFDFATLRRASGRGEEETLDALDELLAWGVLAESSEGRVVPPERPAASLPPSPAEPLAASPRYSFAHPLAAAVVRNRLSGARRAFLFRRAGEALETSFSGSLPEVAGRLSAVYAEAGEVERAASFADMAAERSLALAAPQEAIAFFRQALAILPTPERRLGFGRALSLAGESAAARASTETALAEFIEKGDRLGAARASLELAATYLPVGRGDEVLRWAEMSLAYLDTHAHPEVDPPTHAQAHFLLGAGRLRSGRSLDEAQDQLREAARLAEEKGLPAIAARSRFELGNLYALRGELKEAVAAQHAAVVLSRTAGDRFLEILSLNNAAYHAVLAGDLETARKDITVALALDQEQDLVPPRQYLYSTRGEVALAEATWDEAESWFRQGQAEAERQGNREQVTGYRANLGLAASGRGDLDLALELLRSARQDAGTIPNNYLAIQIDLWLTELYLKRGERTSAAGVLATAESALAGAGYARLKTWASRLRTITGETPPDMEPARNAPDEPK